MARPLDELLAHRVLLADPRQFRQAIPTRIFERWQYGEIDRRELWSYLERLWGSDELARVLGMPIGSEAA